MGFLDSSAIGKQTQVTVLTPGFQARATLKSVGLIQTFINDDSKALFTLDDVSLFGLEAGNPALSVRLAELYVLKTEVHALCFPTLLSRDESGLLPRAEPLAVYTSHYCIQGNFHMGTDSSVSDFMEISKLSFVGASDAAIFPLFKAQSAVIQQVPLVYIHRSVVKIHHRI